MPSNRCVLVFLSFVGCHGIVAPPSGDAEAWVRPSEFSLLFRIADKSGDKRLDLNEFKSGLTTELLSDMQVTMLNTTRDKAAKTLFESLVSSDKTSITEEEFRGVTRQLVNTLMRVAPVPTPAEVEFYKKKTNATLLKTVFCSGVPKGALCYGMSLEAFQEKMTKHPDFLTDAQVEELGVSREDALHEQFEMLDVDHDGNVSWREFQHVPQAGAQLVIERKYAGMAHAQIAPLLMRKHARSKFLDGLVHTARMCRSTKSECCSHDECPINNYCYDKGKAKGKKFSGVGACSPVVSNCCEDRDGDPIDRNSKKCPAESRCAAPQNQKENDDVKAEFDLMQLVRGNQRNKLACKSRHSECCDHNDCLHGQYCRSEGAHYKNTSIYIGKCSNYPSDCCASKVADPIDKNPALCPVTSRCKNDVNWVAVQRLYICKSSQSQCCFHSDCGPGHYCADGGKSEHGTWNWVGKCSAKMEECCSTAKADSLDRHPERCPKAAKCFSDSKWTNFHKVDKLLIMRELGQVRSVRETIFQNMSVDLLKLVDEIQWQPYIDAHGKAVFSDKAQADDAEEAAEDGSAGSAPSDEREAAYDKVWTKHNVLPDMSTLWANAWGTPDTPPEHTFLMDLAKKGQQKSTTRKRTKRHRWVHKHTRA